MIEMNLEKFIVVSKDRTKILTGRGFKDLDKMESTECTPKFFASKSHAKVEMEKFDKGLTDISDNIDYLRVSVSVKELE